MENNQLSQFEIFVDVDPKTIASILSTHPITTYQPGEYLITRFEPNNHIILLLTGSAEVYLSENDEPLNIMNSGESIGEISVLDGHPASAFVIALTECHTICIDKDEIWNLAKQSHAFTFNLLNLLVSRLRSLNDQVDTSIQLQHQMERKATIDALTGLYNRRWFDDHFDDILNRCKENNQPFSFVMVDIDHFKQVNDVYGHAVGDIVLHQTGAILKKHARERDAAVRYGGEEMSLILPNTTLEQSLDIAERLRKAIQQSSFQYAKDKSLNITISLGVSSFTGKEDKQLLMKRADDALYQAKESGRNQIRY